MRKAVFLDRDGVLIGHPKDTYKGYVYEESHIAVLPGVAEALGEMKARGYLLFVVSNQSTIADGYATPEKVAQLHEFLNKKLGNLIDKFYICPHHPKPRADVPEWAQEYRIDCDCRKPAPGMLLRATKDFDVSLEESWLVGDMISDIAAGKAAGCKTIMVESAHSGKIITTAKPLDVNVRADAYVKTLQEALAFL